MQFARACTKLGKIKEETGAPLGADCSWTKKEVQYCNLQKKLVKDQPLTEN